MTLSKFKHKKSIFLQMLNIQLSSFAIVSGLLELTNSKPTELHTELNELTNKVYKKAKSVRSWKLLNATIVEYNNKLQSFGRKFLETKL